MNLPRAQGQIIMVLDSGVSGVFVFCEGVGAGLLVGEGSSYLNPEPRQFRDYALCSWVFGMKLLNQNP